MGDTSHTSIGAAKKHSSFKPTHKNHAQSTSKKASFKHHTQSKSTHKNHTQSTSKNASFRPECCTKRCHKFGTFKRSSDGQIIQRYRCCICKTTVSSATHSPKRYQKKRHLNHACLMLLASGVSMNRIALILGINPKSVAWKLRYLSLECTRNRLNNRDSSITDIQFDELQTIEHTKLKPVSVAMAVSKNSRKILGFQVSKMPATGHLANISRKKYGVRPDQRKAGMRALFKHLSGCLSPDVSIASDECSFYSGVVQHYFPQAHYVQYKGEKSRSYGQGELKKTKNDPLFSINHTFAM